MKTELDLQKPKSRPLIQFREASKTYLTADGCVNALDTTTLDIQDCEFVSILGPSGCGKTTLLMLVSGLIATSTGTITIRDHVVKKPYTDLGMVFQRDVLLDWRTVLDNVLLQVEIRRLKRSEYEPRALQLLDQVGLKEFVGRYPRELSGGMRQRVAICRALIHDPPLLLMDEPFGALDAFTRDQMGLDLLRIWEGRRKTVVFVTHSIPEAIFLSDRVILMSPRPGRVVETIDIDLPRPRHLAVRDTPEFARHNRHVRELFQARGFLVDH